MMSSNSGHIAHSDGRSIVVASGGHQRLKPTGVQFAEEGYEVSQTVLVSNRRVGDDPFAALEATRKAKQLLANGLVPARSKLVRCQDSANWRKFRADIGPGAFTNLLDCLEPELEHTKRSGFPSPAFMHSALTAWAIVEGDHVAAVVVFKSKNGKALSSLDADIRDEATIYYEGDYIFDDLKAYFEALIELWAEKFANEELRTKANKEDAFNALFKSRTGVPYWFPWWKLANEDEYLRGFIQLMRHN